ncbi:MAG: hypothetical protein HY898_12775 [Deltaproteobacteria bacterium]|nr:hypothetical protein [Deltaproteobacteria bacterium]
MPTTVRIPRPLLDLADARAKALRISRNRLIVEALEARLQARDQWPPEFIRMLTEPSAPGVVQAAEEMNEAIHKHRRSRRKSLAL